MADFTFAVGARELQDWIKVAPGEGLDPFDSDLVDPQFSRSPLRVGAAHSQDVVNEREWSVPVLLNPRDYVATNAIQNPGAESGTSMHWPGLFAGFATTPSAALDWSDTPRGGEWAIKYTGTTSNQTDAQPPLGVPGATNMPVSEKQGVYYALTLAGPSPITPGEYMLALSHYSSGAASLITTNYSAVGVQAGAVNGSLSAAPIQAAWAAGRAGVRMEWTATAQPSARFVEPRMHTRVAAQPTYSRLEFYIDNAILVPLVAGSQPGGAIEHFDGDHLDAYWSGARSNSYSISRMGKSGLRDMLGELEQDLQADDALVRWRDQGATHSYYDLLTGRFEPDYNYRRESRNWGGGAVHLWTQPYAHTATERVVATGVATTPLLVVPVASIAGDREAELVARITVGSAAQPREGWVVGVAALPHGSFSPYIPISSMVALYPAATVMGASGAPGSQMIGWDGDPLPNSALTRITLSPASIYSGQRLRMFQYVRNTQREFYMTDLEGSTVGRVARASAGRNGWQALDLGVADLSADIDAATVAFELRTAETWLYDTYYVLGPAAGVEDFTQIGPMIVLPEDSTWLVNDRPRIDVGYSTFESPDRVVYATRGLDGELSEGGYTWRQASVSYPDTLHGPGLQVMELFEWAWPFATGGVGQRAFQNTMQTLRPARDMRVELNTQGFGTYGQGPTTYVGPMKTSDVFGGRQLIARWWPANHSLSLHKNDSGSMTTLASISVPSQSDHLNEHEITLESRANRAWVNIRRAYAGGGSAFIIMNPGAGATQVPVGCVGVALASGLDFEGYPGLSGAATFAVASIANAQGIVNQFRFTAFPPIATRAARDIYKLDGVRSQAARLNASGYMVADVGGLQIGAPLTLAPPTVSVAAFALPADAGPANDIVSVDLRVRERFRFSR